MRKLNESIVSKSTIILLAMLFSATIAYAAPTADQVKAFSNLDPATQQAILQSMQGTGTGNDSSATTTSSTEATRRDKRPQPAGTAGQVNPSLVSVLKPDDSLIISIDFPKAKTTVVGGTNGQPAQVLTIPAPNSDVVLQPLERKKLEDLITLIRSKNPYRLSRDGELLLPGFAPIPVAGLTVDQATARLSAEPAFLPLQLIIALLPLDKTGVAALKPFGYDLFDNDASTFAPVTDAPVPADYIVGAGDALTVQLYGNQNKTIKLIVGRDGRVSFPELGPIHVGGQTFTAVQSELEGRVSRQMIGVRASISMGETRAIRVFVLGETNLPGSYSVSGLGTMTTALFASGGVKRIGSLRNIQLKRQGLVVRTLDLYDMLLNGDTSNDAKLLPGDVIFIPPVGATVAVEGEVKRPAIYELKGASNVSAVTVNDIVELAGGLTSDADITKVSLTRIEDGKRLVVDAAPLTNSKLALRNGDVLTVSPLRPTLDSGITIEGHVHAVHNVAWHSGLRLSDVITSVDELKPNADVHYLIVRRELPPDRTVAVLSADLVRALGNRGSAADIELMPRDRITVFDFETDRSHVIKPILDELKLQSRSTRPTEVVSVSGRIKVAGDYPLEPGMRVSDLIRAGGNLQDAALVSSAELIRYADQDGKRTAQLINIDLTAIANGDVNADVVLQSSDTLTIKELPQWSEKEKVTLRGQVRFPGEYVIQRGETLKQLISRAGGVTDQAYLKGSVFTRRDLQQREQEQLDLLAARMQNDLTTLALQQSQISGTQGQQNNQALSIGQSLLSQLKATRAIGRLVIDLDRVVAENAGAESDISLRNGDALYIPKLQQEVTVIGEVQSTTSHLYHGGLSRDDYIAQSGGFTRKADKKHIYIVRANGSVIANTSHRWYGGSGNVQPGDTIVVPLDAEHIPALPLWQAVTQIVYNIAIAAAAVHSF